MKNSWDVKEIKVALKGYKIEESATKQTGLRHVRKWHKKWMEPEKMSDSIQQIRYSHTRKPHCNKPVLIYT